MSKEIALPNRVHLADPHGKMILLPENLRLAPTPPVPTRVRARSQKMPRPSVPASSGSGGAGAESLMHSSLHMVEGSVTILATHLRLMLSSLRQVRQATERLVTLVPVLQAGEQAMTGLLEKL